jgi:hypothetical protein
LITIATEILLNHRHSSSHGSLKPSRKSKSLQAKKNVFVFSQNTARIVFEDLPGNLAEKWSRMYEKYWK